MGLPRIFFFIGFFIDDIIIGYSSVRHSHPRKLAPTFSFISLLDHRQVLICGKDFAFDIPVLKQALNFLPSPVSFVQWHIISSGPWNVMAHEE